MTVVRDPVMSTGARVTRVENKSRLETRAMTEEDFIVHALRGNSFYAYFVIGNSTLNGTEYGIGYLINNNNTKDMVITSYDAFYGTSTSGTGNASLNIYNNPATTSSLVTNANPAVLANARFGDSNPSQVTAYVGDGTTGNLLTPGPAIPLPTPVSVVRDVFSTPTVLPFGQSIGFSWTTPTGNTGQALTFIVSFYMRDQEIVT